MTKNKFSHVLDLMVTPDVSTLGVFYVFYRLFSDFKHIFLDFIFVAKATSVLRLVIL
jgi:hypothetical protein